MIEPIEKETLIEKGCILIENVQKGMEQYEHDILEGNQEKFQNLIFDMIEQNGIENCYFDFYYANLLKEEQDKIKAKLTKKEQEVLKQFHFCKGKIFYPLQKEIVPFVVSITGKELLFSTLYFGKYPCTLWGNYEWKFPVFYKGEQEKKIYQKIFYPMGIL